MMEQGPAQIPAQAHLNKHSLAGKHQHRQGLEQDHRQVAQPIGQQPPEGVPLDERGNGIPLEQGQQHIHPGAGQVEQQQQDQMSPEGPQQGEQPPPDPQLKGLGILLLVISSHQSVPPSSMSRRSSLLIWIS